MRHLLLLPALLFAVSASAQEMQEAPIAESNTYSGFASDLETNYTNFDPAPYQAQIARVEQYLSHFSSMRARFSQTISDEAVVVMGEMALQRPGKLRLEYMSPERTLLVVNDGKMMYYDKALDQVSYGALPDTPFELLLGNKIQFGKDMRVVDVQEDTESLAVTLQPVTDNKEIKRNFAALTLVFSQQPMELRRIIRTDRRNHSTAVHLLVPRFGEKLDDKLFSLANPTKKKKR